MIIVYAAGGAAIGTLLASRVNCMVSRSIGGLVLGVSLMSLATPTWADQTIMAGDSAQVDCQASAKDLTRISLIEDEFASVSRSRRAIRLTISRSSTNR